MTTHPGDAPHKTHKNQESPMKKVNCTECQSEADKSNVAVDWWCWMFGCSPACDCYGREESRALELTGATR